MDDNPPVYSHHDSSGGTSAPLKLLLEQMIWCWVNDLMMQEFTGKPNTETTHNAILMETQKRCLVPLREAGIIQVWTMRLGKHGNQMILDVDITLPTKEPVHAAH